MPEAGDFGFEKIFALDAGLDELNGVSFTKGCYVGQELTSRMKHRATTQRKRILTVTADAAPARNRVRTVTRGGVEIGELVSVQPAVTRLSCLVRLDRLEETIWRDHRLAKFKLPCTEAGMARLSHGASEA